MGACYLGPLIVVSHNKGGAYIIAELDGSVFNWPVAAFRVIPYFACTSTAISPLDELLDISWSRLTQMEQSTLEDQEEDNGDPTWGRTSCGWLRTVNSKVGRRNGTATHMDPIFFLFSFFYISSFIVFQTIFTFSDYFHFFGLFSLFATLKSFCLGISCITF